MVSYSVHRGVDRHLTIKGFELLYVLLGLGLFLVAFFLFIGLYMGTGTFLPGGIASALLLAVGGVALPRLNKRYGRKGLIKLRAGWSQPAGLRRYRSLRRLMVVKD